MTNLDRLFLLLIAAFLAAFAHYGSAIPGFSGPTARTASTIAAALTIVLVFPIGLRVRQILAVVIVGFLISRGTLAYLLGGPQRLGVFFQHAALALAVAAATADHAR